PTSPSARASAGCSSWGWGSSCCICRCTPTGASSRNRGRKLTDPRSGGAAAIGRERCPTGGGLLAAAPPLPSNLNGAAGDGAALVTPRASGLPGRARAAPAYSLLVVAALGLFWVARVCGGALPAPAAPEVGRSASAAAPSHAFLHVLLVLAAVLATGRA